MFWVECSLGYSICFGILKILESQLLEYNFLPYNISGLHNTEVETRMREGLGGKRRKKKSGKELRCQEETICRDAGNSRTESLRVYLTRLLNCLLSVESLRKRFTIF